MSARLAASVEVSAMIRRAQSSGGNAAVLAKGDPQAGAILLFLAEKGRFVGLFGRSLRSDGVYAWASVGPDKSQDSQLVDAYIARRRTIDGDLWVVELDIAEAERFAAELSSMG